MDVSQVAKIIARMTEDYASVRSTGGADAKDQYHRQAEALAAHVEEYQGIAVSARELDYGPAVKFPMAAFDPLSAGDGAARDDAFKAYAEGASIAVKPKHGSLKLMKFGAAAASRHMLTSPDTAHDAALKAAANGVVRDLQRAKDQEVVRADILEIFHRNDIPANTLHQMDFDQRPDGSIAVSNHPLATEVETLVNSDRGLTEMMSFLFGFHSQAKVTA